MRHNCNFLLSNFISLQEFIIISFVFLVVFTLWYLIIVKPSIQGRVGLLLVVAGGLTNLILRLIKGCVFDYLSFFDLFYFNFPDLLVTLGTVFIIIDLIKKDA